MIALLNGKKAGVLKKNRNTAHLSFLHFWKAMIFIILFLLLFSILQTTFRLKWLTANAVPITGWKDEFFQEAPDSIDVLFIGSSHVFFAVNPLQIWKETGITSFVYASPAQRLNHSLSELRYALQTQNPKVVFLDMRGIQYLDNNEEYALHETFDSYLPSKQKLMTLYQIRQEQDSMAELMIPLFRFHTRWKELLKADWEYTVWRFLDRSEVHYMKGANLSFRTTPVKLLFEEKNTWKITGITKENKNALDDIVSLCKKNNIRLILFKTPTTAWWKDIARMAEEYAASAETPFIDMNTMIEELNINPDTDFTDADGHLNISGMTKVTHYFSEFLIKNYDLSDRRNDPINRSWWHDYELYQAEVKKAQKH